MILVCSCFGLFPVHIMSSSPRGLLEFCDTNLKSSFVLPFVSVFSLTRCHIVREAHWNPEALCKSPPRSRKGVRRLLGGRHTMSAPGVLSQPCQLDILKGWFLVKQIYFLRSYTWPIYENMTKTLPKTARVKIQRNILSITIATNFQSSLTFSEIVFQNI